MLFNRNNEKPYVYQVDEFVTYMAAPVQVHELELGSHDNESRQCTVLGNLCLVYGIFIFLLVFVPNEPSGRVIIFCCGAIITGIGWILKVLGKRSREKIANLCRMPKQQDREECLKEEGEFHD